MIDTKAHCMHIFYVDSKPVTPSGGTDKYSLEVYRAHGKYYNVYLDVILDIISICCCGINEFWSVYDSLKNILIFSAIVNHETIRNVLFSLSVNTNVDVDYR